MPPNTKTTPRKDPKCPMCPFRTPDTEAMKAHLVLCGMNKMEKALKCDHCDYRTEKSGNLKRHMKRHNMKTVMFKDVENDKGQEKEEKLESDNEDWEKSDPGNLVELLGESESISKDSSSYETSDSSDNESIDHKKIEVGHKVQEESRKVVVDKTEKTDPTVRIKTNPPPVFTPNKDLSRAKSAKVMSLRDKLKARWRLAPFKVPKVSRPRIIRPNTPLAKTPSTSKIDSTVQPVDISAYKEPDASVERASIGVQTEIPKTRRVVWKTTRYQEGDRQIEIVEMEETEYMNSSN